MDVEEAEGLTVEGGGGGGEDGLKGGGLGDAGEEIGQLKLEGFHDDERGRKTAGGMGKLTVML